MGKDYEFAKFRSASLPKFRLGQEVMTPIGSGIIVHMAFPHNGLYVTPELATATVWFGTEEAVRHSGYVTHAFELKQLKKIKDENSVHHMSCQTC